MLGRVRCRGGGGGNTWFNLHLPKIALAAGGEQAGGEGRRGIDPSGAEASLRCGEEEKFGVS